MRDMELQVEKKLLNLTHNLKNVAADTAKKLLKLKDLEKKKEDNEMSINSTTTTKTKTSLASN